MSAHDEQLLELLKLSARTMTHLTASVTSLSFELLRSHDSSVHVAATRMIARMETISKDLDEHWRLIGEIAGDQPTPRPGSVREIVLRPAE